MKKLIYGGLLLAVVGIGLGLVGCKKESISDEGETVLGERLPNPFTLKNMRKAYSILSRGTSTNSIQSNQIYVRFLISNSEEAKKLEDKDLILSTIPLDYEVIQYGSFYNDPKLNNRIWMYTTVVPNFNFSGFQYETIAELFLPDLLVGTSQYKTLFSSFDHEDLIDQALKLKGYDDETTEKAVKYRPKGYIRVQQSINGSVTPVPVKRLKIRSRWWFNWGIGYTNDNGYFESSTQYRKNRKVNIICIFENQYVNIRAIKGGQFWDIFFTERKNIGEFQNASLESINYLFQNSTDITTDTKRKWMACHAINSIREQHVFCSQNGVLPPPNNLNLWLTNQNNIITHAAAPMLKQMSNSSLLVNSVQLLLVASGHPWFAIAIQVAEQFPPDITYNYSQSSSFYENSDRISQIFYHEFAHASHYNKVGNNYWLNYITYILTNGGYGNSTTSGSGRIAISESWAEFCGARFAHLRYGSNNSLSQPSPGNWFNKIENFIPYTGTSNWQWIPDGVMHDLTDSGEPGFTGVLDNVNGYSILQCFGSMDADIITVRGYRDRFKLEYGSTQQPGIDELFKTYGY